MWILFLVTTQNMPKNGDDTQNLQQNTQNVDPKVNNQKVPQKDPAVTLENANRELRMHLRVIKQSCFNLVLGGE